MIVLASGSWLRRHIMELAKIDCIIMPADVDERRIENENAQLSNEELVLLLAEIKAKATQQKYPNDIVIGADTFVVLPDGKRLHKPQSAEEAVELCLQQSGQTVKAVTGLVMLKGDRVLKNMTESTITYQHFDRDAILELLQDDDATVRNSGLGFFTDAPGFSLVESFTGSYTGAMGLPMESVRKNLTLLASEDL